jgi:molybdate transport system substrate-binding protein
MIVSVMWQAWEWGPRGLPSMRFLTTSFNDGPVKRDTRKTRDLIDAGLAREDALFTYALGRLAVWTARDDLPAPLDIASLAQSGIAKVAIANPRHAPYGRAAISALKRAGVLDAVEPRLVLGENVAQAAEFVATGAADAGIVALSLLYSGALSDQGTWSEVPIDAHDRIDQGGVVLTNAIDPAAATAVAEVMQSPAGKEILRSYGFYEEG